MICQFFSKKNRKTITKIVYYHLIIIYIFISVSIIGDLGYTTLNLKKL